MATDSQRMYADFWRVTQDAFGFAAHKAGLKLTPGGRDRLMAAWLELKAWPEAQAPLDELKGRGLRLAFLSDASPVMLDSGWRTLACVAFSTLT